MPTRRRSLSIDNRLSWRDPSMPVLRDYRMADGSRKTLVDPEYERGYREFLVETTPHPDWRKDPTYQMNKRKPK